jgi:hypothetical protein
MEIRCMPRMPIRHAAMRFLPTMKGRECVYTERLWAP